MINSAYFFPPPPIIRFAGMRGARRRRLWRRQRRKNGWKNDRKRPGARIDGVTRVRSRRSRVWRVPCAATLVADADGLRAPPATVCVCARARATIAQIIGRAAGRIITIILRVDGTRFRTFFFFTVSEAELEYDGTMFGDEYVMFPSPRSPPETLYSSRDVTHLINVYTFSPGCKQDDYSGTTRVESIDVWWKRRR